MRNFRGASRRRARLWVPAGGRASARATLHPSRRGRFTPTEVVVRVEGPLRLAGRQGRRRLPGVLRVYPQGTLAERIRAGGAGVSLTSHYNVRESRSSMIY